MPVHSLVRTCSGSIHCWDPFCFASFSYLIISVHDVATNRGEVRNRSPDVPGRNGSPRVASDMISGGLRLPPLSPFAFPGEQSCQIDDLQRKKTSRPASIERSARVPARASAMFCATIAFIACCATGSSAPHEPASYRPADQDLAAPKSLNRTRRVRFNGALCIIRPWDRR